MTESAGTAQGVDVALPFVARVQILFSTMVRPYCHRKRWNSARSWCSFALGGGVGGGMERVQTQFFMQKPLEQRKELM